MLEGWGNTRSMRRSWRRWALVTVGALVVFVLVGWVGTAWYFSDQMVKSQHGGDPTYKETVLGVSSAFSGPTVVSLTRTKAAEKPGNWGLGWDGGSAMLGPVLAVSAERVDRPLLSGVVPTAGARAGMSWTHRSDPKVALGLKFAEVPVPTELGPAPAWYIPADQGKKSSTWAIMVHGSNADRQTMLKWVPPVHQAGLPILDITYRNDLGAPASPDKVLHIGESEWRDLEAAVRTALDRGARDVVLYGGSYGGAITTQFLAHSPLAERVRGVVLDAPELSVPATLDHNAQQRHIPAVVTWLATRICDWRTGTDVTRIDVTRYPPKARPPTLILQGSADEAHPASAARQLAADGPRLGWPIRYEEFPGAGHSEAWNFQPQRYEAVVSDFLAGITDRAPARSGH